MKSIIFIGCNEFGTSKEALTIAKKMGYFVVLLTENKKKVLKKHEFPNADQIIYFHSLLDEKTVLNEITKLIEEGKQICACVSFIDPYVSYAATLSKQLGLVEISIDSLYIMENKIRFRERLKDLSISPFYTVFDNELPVEQFALKYHSFFPLILKTPTSNGSKDVLFVETTESLKDSIKFLQKKYPTHPILVEEYLPGPQYLIEIVVYNNEMTIVGVIEQEITNNGRFIIIGYKFPAALNNEEYETLIASIEKIIHQIGLSNGSCHLEMRMVQGEWKLIEINPRMSGGAMNSIIEEGTGINLIKEILKMHLGERPSLIANRKQHVYARYLTISSYGKLLKIAGKEEALKHKGIKFVFIKPVIGSILTSPYSMGHRYACIIAASESPEQAKANAMKAAREIKFYLEPL